MTFDFYLKKKDVFYRLSLLTISAKYDNSCSGSGKKREIHPYGKENPYLGGICYTWSTKGRCISLLKILMTNICKNNCKYCICRAKNDLPRAILTPEEIAYLTIDFYRKHYIEGLFLSSGIYRDPDYTMELMLRAIKILRYKYYFKGYIHLKILPGVSSELIEEAFKLADRVSSNLELPTEESLKKLAPEKSWEVLFYPLKKVRNLYQEKKVKSPASTQLIIGATSDSDKIILALANKLYREKLVRRVYYSAYIPVNKDKDLPFMVDPPFLREYRLYQADWLLRFYGFSLEELFSESDNLPLETDPKLAWALRNPHLFPVELTKADYEILIKVPGIGPNSAKRILQARRRGELSEETLKKLGISFDRIKNFVTLKGKPLGFKKNQLKLGFEKN